MKYLVFIVGLNLMMWSSAFAVEPCRQTMYQPGSVLSHQEMVENDLLINRWQLKNPEGNTWYEFQPNGLVSLVMESVAGDFLYQEYIWKLHDIGGQVFLHLSSPRMEQSKVFVVRQNCTGIIFTEVNEQNHYKLDYMGPKREEAIQILQNDLPGIWKNINDGSQWYFAPDGSIQHPGSEQHISQEGYYFLILDGKYLVINHSGGQSTILRVNSTDFGYLDLSPERSDTSLLLEKTTFTSY